MTHPKPALDVLIITAVRDEFNAVLQVYQGAAHNTDWTTEPGPNGRDIAFRTFQGTHGPMRVGVTYATDMGQAASTQAATAIINAYAVRCLAMCGVCAGRRGKVNLGDVIIADRVWDYDAGKMTAQYDATGHRQERILGDITTYQLDTVWKQAAEGWQPDAAADWLQARPYAVDAQANWLLEKVLLGQDPMHHPDKARFCANWSEILQRLWQAGFLQDGTLNLTLTGRQAIEKTRLLAGGVLAQPEPFRVHVGAMGAGSRVVEDTHIFERLAQSMRKVLGLEMESSAIGTVQHSYRPDTPWMIVMKAVQDFADPEKNDNFRHFAARASAECLIGFLRKVLPAATADNKTHAEFIQQKNHPKLLSLSLSGFKTITQLERFEPQPINLLIGPNGAGKSNFIAFFQLLRHIIQRPVGALQAWIAQMGGAHTLLLDGPASTPGFTATLTFVFNNTQYEYAFQLDYAAGDKLIFAEEKYRINGETWIPLGAGHLESGARQMEWINIIDRLLGQTVVYHFQNTDLVSRLRRKWPVSDNRDIKSDGGNLAPYLLRMKARNPWYYENTLQLIRRVAPFFDHFDLTPEDDAIVLKWREKGSDIVFDASQASDGMLRIFALITVLSQPTEVLPGILILDEPEMGLHPYALEVISGLILSLSEHIQIIIATQSETLLDYFEPNSIIIVERKERQSSFRRLDPETLADWLETYSNSELWEKNVLGGRP